MYLAKNVGYVLGIGTNNVSELYIHQSCCLQFTDSMFNVVMRFFFFLVLVML